jgi:hypothetical protein
MVYDRKTTEKGRGKVSLCNLFEIYWKLKREDAVEDCSFKLKMNCQPTELNR